MMQYISEIRTKYLFAKIVLLILLLIPVVVMIVGTTLLLSGEQSAGTRFTQLPVDVFSLHFLTYYFGDYLPRLILSIPFYVLMFSVFAPGIPLLFPILGIMLIGWVASSCEKRIHRHHAELRISRVLNRTLIVLIGFYIFLGIAHVASQLKVEHDQADRVNVFNQAYGFSDLNPNTTFLYFEWVVSEGFYRKVNLVSSKLNGANKQYHNEIPLNYGKGISFTPQFPSPRGSYYIKSSNAIVSFEAYVSDMNGVHVFEIPNAFYNFRKGVIRWSPDERYLAIFSSTTTYPKDAGKLIVYDLKQKKQLSSFKDINYGSFTWSDGNTLYHPCEDHLCETRYYDDGNSETLTFANTVNCSALAYLNEKVYCSVTRGVVEKTLGKKIEMPDMDFVRGRRLGDNYIISQEVSSGKPLIDSVHVITIVPMDAPNVIDVIDSGHVVAISSGGLYTMTVVDLENGRIMDLGTLPNNIYSPLVSHINLGDLPVVYMSK